MFKFLRRVVTIGLVGAALVVLAANENVQERFKGLIDPTEPLQLSLKGVDAESLGLRVNLDSLLRLAADYRVSSIIIRGDKRIAVVNDERVEEGSEIDGAVVASIDREGVTLTRGIEEFRVELYGASPKKKRVSDD
jgi:hypothetical protein